MFFSNMVRFLNSSAARADASHVSPAILRRWRGHTGMQAPQAVQRKGSAPVGHVAAQAPQSRQETLLTISWGYGAIPSGLWHHAQRNGHPLRNTVVRIPGPSYTAISFISNTSPCIPVLHHPSVYDSIFSCSKSCLSTISAEIVPLRIT